MIKVNDENEERDIRNVFDIWQQTHTVLYTFDVKNNGINWLLITHQHRKKNNDKIQRVQ